MRITVTLQPETERLIREALRLRGQSLTEALNDAVLKGLADLDAGTDDEPFVADGSPMGLLPGYDPAHLNGLNDDLEAQAFVELTHSNEARSGKR